MVSPNCKKGRLAYHNLYSKGNSGYLRITEHLLQINLLLAIGTRLLLAHNAPASYAELVENMITGELVGVLDDALFLFRHQQLIAAHRAHILIEMPCGHTLRRVVLQWNTDTD